MEQNVQTEPTESMEQNIQTELTNPAEQPSQNSPQIPGKADQPKKKMKKGKKIFFIILCVYACFLIPLIVSMIIHGVPLNSANTRKNLNKFLESPYAAAAKTLENAWDEGKKTVPEDCPFRESQDTPLNVPYCIVKAFHEYYDSEPEWHFLYGNIDDDLDMLVLCSAYQHRVDYKSRETHLYAGTGTSEYADLLFLNLDTGTFRRERVKAKSLPDMANTAPHYKLEDWDLISEIQETIQSYYPQGN